MNKFIILIIVLNLNSCECNFVGNQTFVKWERNKNEFVNTNIDIGSLEYSLNIESCKKEKNKLKITTSVYLKNQYKIMDKSKNHFYIIGNNLQRKKLDTISSFINLKNEFSVNLKDYDYFIFIEQNNEIGTKYLIKDFK